MIPVRNFGIYFEKECPAYLLDLISEVSEKLVLEKLSQTPENSFFLYSEKGLSFIDHDLGELHLDFIEDHRTYQRKAHRGKSELIVKALGLEKKTDQIIDATLGLASDALFLVQLGYSVRGYERSPIVFLLLQDACRRWQAQKPDTAGNLSIEFKNSIDVLSSQIGRVIYIDPMFPEKKKSALPKKEMQIFKKWVGEDPDGVEILRQALRSSADRVVVKRPMKAADLLDGVVHSFRGTTVRYDLYTPGKRLG